MPVVLTRIDQKLIHGQIISGWVPFLDINKIMVVDDETTQSPMVMRILASGVPASITTIFMTPDRLAENLEISESNATRCLILFKDVFGAKEALCGSSPANIESINLGYYAHTPGVKCVKIHTFFSAIEEELEQLTLIAGHGTELYAQPVPNAPKVHINPAKFVWPWP
jgi:mannose/fructose/N-acetylgalactosamine-specific phosphotransferase system component IIB